MASGRQAADRPPPAPYQNPKGGGSVSTQTQQPLLPAGQIKKPRNLSSYRIAGRQDRRTTLQDASQKPVQTLRVFSLHPDHLQDLNKSGLTPEDLRWFGVGVWSLTPTDLEGFLKAVGFGWALQCARSGYVLQYADGYFRVRLFWHECGHKERHPKYIGPPGISPPAFVIESVRALAGKRHQAVAITEGEKKAVALCKAGVPAIGIGGVWCFRGPDGNLVEPLDAWDWRDRIVYLIPDSDWRVNADVVQAWVTLGLLLAGKGAACYVVTWAEDLGKGVDDAIVAGLDVQQALRGARPLADWVAGNAPRFRSAVLGALASVGLPADLADGLYRAIAKAIKASPKAIRMEVKRRREAKAEAESADIPEPEPTPEVRAWLCRPDLADAVLEAVRHVHAGDDDNVLALLLAWASLRFDEPVSVLIQGPPSTGKSHLLETLRSLWPPESYVFRSSLSPKALAYTSESLAHRAVILAEAVSLATSDESGYLLRTLLSEGRIVHESVEKTASGLKAIKMEREGPTALFATTTRHKLEEQLISRAWVLESKSDSTYLNTALDAVAFGDTEAPHADEIRNALTWLYWHGNPHVRIPEPLMRAIRGLFPGKDPVELRVFKRLLASIRASAFLHQLQRPRDANGAVLATPEDYRIARQALAAAFESATGDLTPKMQETWQAVRNLEGAEGATLSDIARALGIRKNAARERLKSLIAKGYVAQDKESKRYRTIEVPERGVWLPEQLHPKPGPEHLNGGPQNGPSSGTEVFRSAPERDLNGLNDPTPDPAVQVVQARSDRGPERQETAPVRDSGPGVQVFRSERDTKVSANPPDRTPPDPSDGPKIEPKGLNSQTPVDGLDGPGKASRPSEANGPPENRPVGGAAMDVFRPQSYEPVLNPHPVTCAGCGQSIAIGMAVRSKDDPQGRVWHMGCAPVSIR
jgi:DNA-binding MarR family transcriptional regulator